VKQLLFCLVVTFSLHSFNLPFQFCPDKLKEIRTNLNNGKAHIEKDESLNTALSIVSGAVSKIALLSAIACMTSNHHKGALFFGGLSGVLEACSSITSWKVAHASQQQANIMIAENILVLFQNALPNDKNQQ
jgi:hypothetical protein